jgi:glycosyltransferase involved in cell wall biosynthesis
MKKKVLVLASKIAYQNNRYLLEHLEQNGLDLIVQIVPTYKILKYFALIFSFRLGKSINEWRNKAVIYYEKMHKSPWIYSKRTKFCKKIIKQMKGKIDLIFQFYGMFMPTDDFKNLNIPYVVFLDYTMKLAEKYHPWLPFRSQLKGWYELETSLYKNAVFNFTWSENTRLSLMNNYGVGEDKVIALGRGVPLDRLPNKEKKIEDKTVLFVGIDFERKGGFVLLEAFDKVKKEIKDAKLIIVGPRKEALKIKNAGVVMLGRVIDREELGSLYEKASVFVMPSLCEPFARVFLEAMAYKLPCIGTTTDSIPEIIEDGKTGFLVAPNNSEALAERMCFLLSRPEVMKEMGEAGYVRLKEKYNWNEVAEEIKHNLLITLGDTLK